MLGCQYAHARCSLHSGTAQPPIKTHIASKLASSPQAMSAAAEKQRFILFSNHLFAHSFCCGFDPSSALAASDLSVTEPTNKTVQHVTHAITRWYARCRRRTAQPQRGHQLKLVLLMTFMCICDRRLIEFSSSVLQMMPLVQKNANAHLRSQENVIDRENGSKRRTVNHVDNAVRVAGRSFGQVRQPVVAI